MARPLRPRVSSHRTRFPHARYRRSTRARSRLVICERRYSPKRGWLKTYPDRRPSPTTKRLSSGMTVCSAKESSSSSGPASSSMTSSTKTGPRAQLRMLRSARATLEEQRSAALAVPDTTLVVQEPLEGARVSCPS